MWEKQTAKLHEEGKYARESARNYGDRVRCVLLSVLAFLPPQLLLNSLFYKSLIIKELVRNAFHIQDPLNGL